MKPKALTLLILTAIVMASVACSSTPSPKHRTVDDIKNTDVFRSFRFQVWDGVVLKGLPDGTEMPDEMRAELEYGTHVMKHKLREMTADYIIDLANGAIINQTEGGGEAVVFFVIASIGDSISLPQNVENEVITYLLYEGLPSQLSGIEMLLKPIRIDNLLVFCIRDTWDEGHIGQFVTEENCQKFLDNLKDELQQGNSPLPPIFW